MLIRRWPLVLALGVLGAAVGWFLTPEEASGEDTVYRATNVSFIQEGAPSGLTPAQIAFLVDFDEVPQRVSERLDVNATALIDQVDARADPDLGILEITASSRDASRAEQIADTFAEELDVYLAERATVEQNRQVEALQERIAGLEEEFNSLNSEIAAATPANVEILTEERNSVVTELRSVRDELQQVRASAPRSGLRPGRAARAVAYSGPGVLEEALAQIGADPSDEDDGDSDSEREAAREEAEALDRELQLDEDELNAEPDPILWAGAGGAGGVLLGLAIVALMARFDTRVRTKQDAEAAYRLPVLAEVPPVGRKNRDQIILLQQPDTRAAESYRSLRTALALARLPEPPVTAGQHEQDVRVLMVNAPNAGDGASTVAANVAAALAEARMRVLVIDADFRKPRVGSLLDAGSPPPLGDASEPDLNADVSRFTATTGIDGVWFARTIDPEAPPTAPPSELIAAQRTFVTAARERFDVIVVDTAPSLSTNDAGDLVPVTDAVVFAARTGRTSMPDADRVTEQFERLVAPMAGVVLLASSEAPAPRRGGGAYNARFAAGVQENGRVRESTAVEG